MVRWNVIVLVLVFLLFGNYSFMDIGDAVKFYGEKLSDTHPMIGTTIFLVLFMLLFFSDEFINLIKKKRLKVKKDF